MIVIVCDNGGFAVINRLQVNQGGAPFNNLLADSKIVEEVRVDFAAHAAAMGCHAETVDRIEELEAGVAAGQAGRPHDGHRVADPPELLDRGRRVVGGRGAGGVVEPECARCPRRARRGQGRAASGLVMADRSFEGRVGLITGGSPGPRLRGRAPAQGEGGERARPRGARRREGKRGGRVAHRRRMPGGLHRADLYEPDARRSCVAAVDDAFGSLHATVNCAAKTDRGSVWDSTAEMWDDMLALNVRAAALIAQESAKLMVRERVDGSIVLIGSVARHGGAPNLLPYSASKMALVAATRNMAFSLMRHRVRVNMINPGWMDTPNEDLTQRRWEGATDGWLERAEAEQPWGKLIKPDEIAHTIVHLCSPDSGFLTGQDIDWDQTIIGVGPGVRPGPELGELPPELQP